MQRPTIISRKWLDGHGACREQAQLFERVWPDGVAVTRETLELSAKAGLILKWLAKRVLPRPDYDDYQAQRKPLFADYLAQRAALYAAYRAQSGPLYAAYRAQSVTLEAAYRAQSDTLLINAVCNLYASDAPALPESSCATEAGRK